jgi:hypothetical protein
MLPNVSALSVVRRMHMHLLRRWRGITMMSAAISIVAGMEETKSGSGSPLLGYEAVEDASFATSLSEHIETSASPEGQQSRDNLATTFSSMESATATKKVDEIAQTPSGVKQKPIADHGPSVQHELKFAVANNVVQTQVMTVTGSGANLAPANEATNVPELRESTIGDSPYRLSGNPLPLGVPDQGTESNVKTSDGDQPVPPMVPNCGSPVDRNEPGAAKKDIGDALLKNIAKPQEKPSTETTVQKKTAKTISDTTLVALKPAVEILTSNSIPIAEQAIATKIASPGEIRTASDTSGLVVSAATKPSAGLSLPAVDNHVRKVIASGTKTSVTESSTAALEGSDSAAPLKTDPSSQKIPAVATPDRSEGDAKQQAVRESSIVPLHPAGIATTAVASGDSFGGPVVIKQAAGDAGLHSAGLPIVSKEQEGTGVATQFEDGAPRMLSSTPTSLEVGIQNGTHGWLKVRAEMADGGAVNASVSATSSVGQEMLHRELPALTAYLQEEKVTVNAVIVHSTPAAGTDARASTGMESAGGQTPQRSNEGEQKRQNGRETTLNGIGETMSYGRWHGVDEDGSLPLAAYVNGGTWLSVRA